MSFPVISPLIGTCCKQPPPMNKCQILAFEGGNSWYFATPTLVSLKRCLRNDCRNSILMTGHYSGLGSASDWLKICFIQSEALYPDLSSDMSSLWHFCSQMFSDVFWEETIGGQKSAVFSGQYHRRSDCTTLRCWNRSLYVSGVSGKLPTYPSPKPTLTLTSHLGQNVNDNVPLELCVFLFKGWKDLFPGSPI